VIRTQWVLLFVPPVTASLLAYFLVKKVNGIKEKIVVYWLLWASIAILVHILIGLSPLIAITYPLLALGTGIGMLKGVGRFAREGYSGRNKN